MAADNPTEAMAGRAKLLLRRRVAKRSGDEQTTRVVDK
jgi:hypothetical protein